MRHLIMPLLAVTASVLSTGLAYADLGDQLFKLLADDSAAEDRLGWSVAISGPPGKEIVIVGGPQTFGWGRGVAYLFDATSGRQIAKLLTNDGAQTGNKYGWSVAISGDTAIVGAPEDDDNGTRSGSAYLFDLSDPNNPIQIAKLLADDGAQDDFFGLSVGISGPTAIVGAYQDDDQGDRSGSAYFFDTTTGRQITKLLPEDGEANKQFGFSVAISGTTAIVGALKENDSNTGSAYLFDTTTGLQITKLLPNDGYINAEFGRSVAISGTTAIVGARFDNGDNANNTGSAYLFDTTKGQQVAKLLANDGAGGIDWFGFSVAISGSIAMVGKVFDDDNGTNSGSAYLFHLSDPKNPIQVAKLLPDDGAELDEFGFSVAISETTAIVGAPRDDDYGDDTGSAYLFEAAACPWDLDGTGTVGASDVLSLLASWGPCKGCPADFDDNGTVGASDLLALLANWGLCS